MKLPPLIPRFPVAKPPLTLACGCFLQLPEDQIAKGELPNYEKYYRETNPAFHHREGYYFFFEFNTAFDRNKFLLALAKSYKQMGMATKMNTYRP